MSIRINLNRSGLVLFFAWVIFLVYSNSISISPLLVLFLMGGVVLLAAARLWGRGTVKTFIFAVLWAAYWSFTAYNGFVIWGLFALSGWGWFVFWLSLYMSSCFGVLAIANLLILFLIPKPESKS